MTKKKIHNLCKSIRKDLLKLNLFGNSYNRKDLAGACGLVSMLLQKQLSKNKIKSNIYWRPGRTHVWVETKEFLIDPTYSQFKVGSPAILIIKKNSKEYDKFLKEGKEKGNIRTCQKDYRWVLNHTKEEIKGL